MLRMFLPKISKMEYLPSRVLQKIFILLTLGVFWRTILFMLRLDQVKYSLQALFTIFRLIPNWTWNCLPSSYRSSAYLSTEAALQNPLTIESLPSSNTSVSETCNDIEVTDENLTMTDMPHEMVCDLHTYKVYFIIFFWCI